MNKGFFGRIRTFMVMGSLAAFMFSVTSCCLLCNCPCSIGGDGGKNMHDVKRHQEMLAAKGDPQCTKTGVILAFKKEGKDEIHNTSVTIPENGYKDLSFRYNLRKRECSASQGRHTYATAGPNINFKSSGSDAYSEGSHKPGVGFQLGFQTVHHLDEKFSVVPGLMLKQNNAKESTEIIDGGEPPYNTSYKIEDKYSYTYLSAPILAQYNLTDNLTLRAGPEVNYLLNAKVNSTTTMAGQDHSEKTKLTKESVRVGVGVQAGIKFDIPDSRWGIELMYDHRLSRLNKKHPDGYPNYEVPAWRMKSLQLSAKARICDLGKKHPQ